VITVSQMRALNQKLVNLKREVNAIKKGSVRPYRQIVKGEPEEVYLDAIEENLDMIVELIRSTQRSAKHLYRERVSSSRGPRDVEP
jgi:hypothetical protein